MSQRKPPITWLALSLCSIIVGTFIRKLAEYTENITEELKGKSCLKFIRTMEIKSNDILQPSVILFYIMPMNYFEIQ